MNLQNSLSDMFQGMPFFIPELLMLSWILIITLFELFIRKADEKSQSNYRFFIAYLGIFFTLIFSFQRSELNYYGPLGKNLFLLSPDYYQFSSLIIGGGILLLIFTQLIKKNLLFEELISFWTILMGGLFTACSAHWLTALLSIETMTLGTYGLIAIQKTKMSYRALIPYLFLGLTMTAILIYGISLIYGFTGTLEILGNEFSRGFGNNRIIGTIGISMVGLAFLFKMAIVPAHPWVPEVIETLPAQWMTLLTTIPKLAIGFLGIRILQNLHLPYLEALIILTILTMALGNFGALRQRNTKRLLAYSSIAHGGFMAMVWINPSLEAYDLLFFYGMVYFLASLLGFFLLDRPQKDYQENDLSEYAGLGTENWSYGLLVVIAMIGLIGFPPAPSIWAKISYFSFIWNFYTENGNPLIMILFIISILFTAISVFYYLRIPYQLFLKKSDGKNRQLIPVKNQQFIFWILAILFLGIFLFPKI